MAGGVNSDGQGAFGGGGAPTINGGGGGSGGGGGDQASSLGTPGGGGSYVNTLLALPRSADTTGGVRQGNGLVIVTGPDVPAVVPLPAALPLLALGLGVLGLVGRRRAA